MTTDDGENDQRTDPDRRAKTELLANGAGVAGTVFTIVTWMVEKSVPWLIPALVAFGVCALAWITIFARTRHHRLRLVLRATPYLLAVAVVGLTALAILFVVRNPKDLAGPDSRPTLPTPTAPSDKSPSPSDSSSPPSSPALAGCPRMATTATIRNGKDSSASSVRLVDASYTLTPTDTPGLEWAGRVEGRPSADEVLYLVGTSDPSTQDSNPERNFGTTNFKIIAPISLNREGCWTVPRRPVGYDCAGGVTFWHSLALMKAGDAQRLVLRQKTDRNLRENGFEEAEFESVPVQVLQTFDVDTSPAACK